MQQGIIHGHNYKAVRNVGTYMYMYSIPKYGGHTVHTNVHSCALCTQLWSEMQCRISSLLLRHSAISYRIMIYKATTLYMHVRCSLSLNFIDVLTTSIINIIFTCSIILGSTLLNAIKSTISIVYHCSHIVAVLLSLPADLHLDEASIPQQHVAPLRPREYLTVRELHVGWNIGDLNAAKLTQLALKLQTSERGRHLPESRHIIQSTMYNMLLYIMYSVYITQCVMHTVHACTCILCLHVHAVYMYMYMQSK